MTALIKSTKQQEVSAFLSTLQGEHNLQDIVDTILQISNFKNKTLPSLPKTPSYTGGDGEALCNIWVDMTYQRRIRLKKIITKLVEWDGYDPDLAGTVDLSVRPSQKMYVWDGCRRVIMAGVVGMARTRVNKRVQNENMTEEECQMDEARLLEGRNTKLEGMKPEEVFKAQVVQKREDALDMLQLLKDCNLDVEGIVGKGILLGGFTELSNNYKKGHHIEKSYFIQSSDIIRAAFPNDAIMSVFLFVGLAYLLKFINDKSDDIDVSYSAYDLKDAMIEYAKKTVGMTKRGDPIHVKQSDLCNPRINGQTCESVAWIVATNVLEDTDGLKNELEKKLNDEMGILIE